MPGLALALGLLLLASPAWGYIVFLKDGTQLSTKDKYRIEGDKAYLTMLSGTESVIDASEIDIAKTEEVNQVSYGKARLIEGGKAVKIKPPEKNDERETLSGLLRRTGGQLAPPPSAPSTKLPDEQAGSALPSTAAGFVDLREVRRLPHPEQALSGELVGYLRDQELDGVSVFQGSRPGFALVDIETETEATVFKAMRDCANALVQLREGPARSLAGLEVLMTASNGARGGQFTLTPELADVLLSGTLKPEAFFLRYVEF